MPGNQYKMTVKILEEWTNLEKTEPRQAKKLKTLDKLDDISQQESC